MCKYKLDYSVVCVQFVGLGVFFVDLSGVKNIP
jgi:hypothetical protein